MRNQSSVMAIALAEVWKAADALGRRYEKDAKSALDEWGLFLEIPPKRWTYFCTPKNAVTFASTGGDGVHYSLLAVPGLDAQEQPVVMTVPMSSRHNVVVAENLQEFLNLGYYAGWFSLEQIVYRPEVALKLYAAADDESGPEDLAFFRETLRLRHQPLTLERIRQLEKKYLSLVVADDEPPPG